MEAIYSLLKSGFDTVVPFIILLGILIFVHELGHFLVAVFYGVRVEVFSLGFGKKLLRYKRGDTEYCLSLIPFGGYVKMYGDDPQADIPEDQKKFSFSHKPVGQRIAVVLAGPLMNFFFAGVVFALIAMVGEREIKSILGNIKQDSVAYSAGFRTGDELLKIKGADVKSWKEVQNIIEDNGNKNITFQLKRFETGEIETINTTPKIVENKNILSTKERVGEIEGLSNTATASAVGISNPNSLGFKAGIRTGDFIDSIDGKETQRWIDLVSELKKLNGGEAKFKIARLEDGKKEEKLDLNISLPSNWNEIDIDQRLSELGFEKPDLFIGSVVKDSAAEEANLQVGDKIVSINGVKTQKWEELVRTVKDYKSGEPAFKVEVSRLGEIKEMSILPREITIRDPLGNESKQFALGVVSGLQSINLTFISKTMNPLKAIKRGIDDTLDWTKMTCVSFLRLAQAKVSPKSIGGPILIGQLASRTFEVGLSPFLRIMGIISINLFILNLLPIPVLDGGHLVFFSIEALRGAPLSMRKMEIAQQVGLVLLLGLMLFAIFNDVSRLLSTY